MFDPHKDYVAAVLGVGRENAMTAKELARLFGLSDERIVTKEIQAERQRGVPVCASCGVSAGYFISDSPDEITRYVRTLDSRIKEIHKTRTALLLTADKLSGQTTLGDW
jgi:predicted DNA-binding transcriptional regulator YafY